MKVIAYITECCNELKKSSDVVGLSNVQDLLDKYKSFPTISNPEKSDIHYCTRCYNKFVLATAGSLCDRKNDENEYIQLIKIHSHAFKQNLILKASARTKKEVLAMKK
jgi:hypothetical protein